MQEIKIINVEISPVSGDQILKVELLFNTKLYQGFLIKEKE